MKENPTEEEKQKDREKRLKELDVIADSQSGDEKLGTLAVMAEIGKSIIPD